MTEAELRARASYFAAAKEAALEALERHGPRTAAESFLARLRTHPDLAGKPQFFAFTWLDVTRLVLPGGAPAVRAWLEGFPWPGALDGG